jgi:hypothetical protein
LTGSVGAGAKPALGSARNSHRRIDLLPQAWAIISGAAEPHRAQQARAASLERLVNLGPRRVRRQPRRNRIRSPKLGMTQRKNSLTTQPKCPQYNSL